MDIYFITSNKKKFEEEKGRSHSTKHIRESDYFMKIKYLENELQKKDQKIGKLEKERLNLENEIIQQSVEFNTKLEEMKRIE